MHDLVCFSHLRWDFVWQRPQQILSRLSKHYRVFFVEEPVTSSIHNQPELETFQWHDDAGRQVTIIKMMQPSQDAYWIGHGDPQTSDTYNRLLVDYMKKQGIEDPIVWFYTPMAADFLNVIHPRLLIYDVMDQLSAFKGAPFELVEKDLALLQQADIVFTGGVSLFRDKSLYNPNTYLFPSGVDIQHFSQTTNLPLPHDLQGMPHPIMGYFGVIDERVDIELLRHMANEHPEWQIAMLGPIIKISYDELPKAPNLHYLGMKAYHELPSYLSQFDVAMVPFTLNEATRYVSPTKVLEYMAAHKPIVSTAIHDIIELYGDVVYIGHNPSEFVEQIEHILVSSPTSERREREDKLLIEHTWDAIASEMALIIEDKVQQPNIDQESKIISKGA